MPFEHENVFLSCLKARARKSVSLSPLLHRWTNCGTSKLAMEKDRLAPKSGISESVMGYGFKNRESTGAARDERDERSLEEIRMTALKGALALQVQKAMDKQNITKVEMARRMKTSRAALNRFLDPGNASLTLQTLFRAAKAIGCDLRIELI
jgi:antitoxin HicB